MKITIYTITECAFSKQEKEYLSSHGLQFEEKNLETNREFLTEMLAVGNNFAGTPVTKVEKDDGQTVVLKGFTASEFDKALALAPTSPAEPTSADAPVGKSVEPVQTQAAPVAEVTPTSIVDSGEAKPAEVAPVTPPQAEVAPAPPFDSAQGKPVADPAMANVLNTLEQKAVPATPPVEVPPAAPVAPAPMPGAPTIPDPQF